jgi:hypothetical protein
LEGRARRACRCGRSIPASEIPRAVLRSPLARFAENDVGVSFYESRGFERFETEEAELAGVETTQYWYRKEL